MAGLIGAPCGPCLCDTREQVFDQNVTRVAVSDDASVRRLLAFYPPLPLGVTLSGAWVDNSAMVIIFTNVSLDPGGGAAVGSWIVQVLATGGLHSAVGQSAPSNASIVVAFGAW